MLQAVIFDFDGVITDSEILHFRAFNKVLAGHGCELAKKEYYSRYLGLSDIDCFKTLIDEGRLQIGPSEVPHLIQTKTRIFEELARTDGKIIEGVREFLALLAAEKVRTAICSGALRTEIELILEDANLRHFFEVIVSAEDVKRGKPHPDGFLLALKRLNHVAPPPSAVIPAKGDCATTIAAKHCVVIEDSHWGLQAARAAGMKPIAVTNTYEADQLSVADKIVTRLDTLTMNDLEQLCPS